MRTWATAVTVALAAGAIACNAKPAATPAEAPSALTPVLSVKELMQHIVDPQADYAFDAVVVDVGPKGVVETHVSLFDGSNCGLALDGKPVFSVQHHPEASPGPQDSHYLFKRFVNMMREQKGQPPHRER